MPVRLKDFEEFDPKIAYRVTDTKGNELADCVIGDTPLYCLNTYQVAFVLNDVKAKGHTDFFATLVVKSQQFVVKLNSATALRGGGGRGLPGLQTWFENVLTRTSEKREVKKRTRGDGEPDSKGPEPKTEPRAARSSSSENLDVKVFRLGAKVAMEYQTQPGSEQHREDVLSKLNEFHEAVVNNLESS